MKTTQTSNSLDNNNCTVLALKSVTGWTESKCQKILADGGRIDNKGFDITKFISANKGKIENIRFKEVYKKLNMPAKRMLWAFAKSEGMISGNWSWENESIVDKLAIKLGYSGVEFGDKNANVSLKRFVKENPKGVFYIIVKGHALAIINGVIVDNLSGKKAGEHRQIVMAYKVSGKIKPNVGVITELDMKPKRYKRLKYDEVVKYTGEPILINSKPILKKNQYVRISSQMTNGNVKIAFRKNNSIFGIQLDRAHFEITPERQCIWRDEESKYNIVNKDSMVIGGRF